MPTTREEFPEEEWTTALEDVVDAILAEHPEIEVGDAVRKTIASLSTEQLEAAVSRLLTWHVRKRLRARTRQIERRAQSGSPEARKQLLREKEALPDGRFVAFGQMTADDHLARAGWLRSHANDTLRTVAMHEEAAARILNAGARCLDEIEGAA